MTLAPPSGRTHDISVAGAIGRLTAEFHGRLRPHVVSRVVFGCRHDLSGSPEGALPELVERLARQRLLTSALPAAHRTDT